MLGGTIHDTEASPPPTAHDVKDTERRASYNSSTQPYRAPHGPGTARARAQVKGHSGDVGNDAADKCATWGLNGGAAHVQPIMKVMQVVKDGSWTELTTVAKPWETEYRNTELRYGEVWGRFSSAGWRFSTL